MAENESVYHAEREALRSTIRDRVLDELVETAFTQASHDELLAIVIEDYDPEAYTEAEKAQLVDDRETEIRSALRTRIEAEDDGEIATAVDERLASNREAIRANVSSGVESALVDVDPAIVDPATDLALVAVDGYVADMSHDEFRTAFEAAGDELAVGVASVLESELDEQVPDELDLTEQIDPATREDLDSARQAVQLVDGLAIGLPVLGLALMGILYVVSQSIAVTAIGSGVGLVIGGMPTLVGASQVTNHLGRLLSGGELPPGIDSLLLALAGQVADAVLLQSGVVVSVGGLVLAGGLLTHFEVVDWRGFIGEE